MGRLCGRMVSRPVKQSNPSMISVLSEFFPAGRPHCTEIAEQHQGQSSMVGNQKAMLEHALAKVMNLGLNCKQVMGPVCLPSSTATFIPLSPFQTWILPSSEPKESDKEDTIAQNTTQRQVGKRCGLTSAERLSFRTRPSAEVEREETP